MGLANLLVPALVGWALCGATIVVGRILTSLQRALIAHAIAAPIIFGAASFVYFHGSHYTTPLQTAIIYETEPQRRMQNPVSSDASDQTTCAKIVALACPREVQDLGG